MLNSRQGLFAATPRGSGRQGLHPRGHPFSRGYGVNLPSSLTGVLSRACGYSPRPPVSVCGTGTPALARGFSGQSGRRPLRPLAGAPRRVSAWSGGGFACRLRLGAWTRHLQRRAGRSPLRPPFARGGPGWYRNVDRFPIAYALRPRLRSRLPLSGRTWLRNPQASGGPDSHRPCRYLCRHSPFRPLHPGLRSGFAGERNAPLPRPGLRPDVRSFGGGLSPVHFRRRAARPVSYYALFE